MLRIFDLGDFPSTSKGIVEDLQVVQKNRFLVPQTYVLELSPYAMQETESLAIDLDEKLSRFVDLQGTYAVLIDDWKTTSQGYLRTACIKSVAELKQKIILNLMNLESAEKTFKNSNPRAIIVSQMPNRQFSGFIFTRNPLNGLDEAVLEFASENPNEATQPENIVIQNGKALDEKGREILSRYAWLGEVVAQASSLEKLVKEAVFLEWIYDGKNVFWVQLRRLEGSVSSNVYSNKIAKDMLPGLIKPLVWSINTKINSRAWKHLIDRLIGKNNFELSKMTKRFYYRAYFNMGLFGDFFALFGMPRETLEVMMLGETHSRKTSMPKMKMNAKVARFLPRITFLLIRNVGISKKVENFIQNQKPRINSCTRDISKLDEKETLSVIKKLSELNEECAFYVIIVRMIRSFHHTILRSMLRRKGLDCNIEIRTDDLTDVDAKYSIVELKKKFEALPQETKDELRMGQVTLLQDKYPTFSKEYESFQKRFGHMSDSTADMSVPQWQENPAQVIEMIRTGNTDLKGPVKNQIFPKGLYGFVLKFFVDSFAGFEKQSARLGYLYTYGYARFRPYFLHLGELFAAKKFVNESTDIFYLDMDEIRTIIETQEFSQKYLEAIKERKTEIEKCKDILLPEVIFGDTPPPIVRKGAISRLFKGLPVSRGYFEGKVKVVKSISEAAKVLEGDVLVIPYSDISWTPLLSKAGAIISEAGGLLSHCSIVARELGIPAVVGVEGATMIPDNTEARIDGYTGEVLVIQ